VVLIEPATFLRDDPESGKCIADQVPRWKRYDNASFAYDAEAPVATLSLEIPLARSAKAALNEARDAVYRFILVCVGFRDDYEVRGLSVKLLTEKPHA